MSSSPCYSSSSSSTSYEYNGDGTYPVGFQFYPCDHDIVHLFLINKVLGASMPKSPIKELDIYRYNPENLPITINNGSERWMYFFVYMTEENETRSTPSGHWKVVEGTEPIRHDQTGKIIAFKNSLVYYTREAESDHPNRTCWKMEEFRMMCVENLEDPMMKNWVLCKIETIIPQEDEVNPEEEARRKKND